MLVYHWRVSRFPRALRHCRIIFSAIVKITIRLEEGSQLRTLDVEAVAYIKGESSIVYLPDGIEIICTCAMSPANSKDKLKIVLLVNTHDSFRHYS